MSVEFGCLFLMSLSFVCVCVLSIRACLLNPDLPDDLIAHPRIKMALSVSGHDI